MFYFSSLSLQTRVLTEMFPVQDGALLQRCLPGIVCLCMCECKSMFVRHVCLSACLLKCPSPAETGLVCPQDRVWVSATPPAQNSHWLSPSVCETHLCFGTFPTVRHSKWRKRRKRGSNLSVCDILSFYWILLLLLSLKTLLSCDFFQDVLVLIPAKRLKAPWLDLDTFLSTLQLIESL